MPRKHDTTKRTKKRTPPVRASRKGKSIRKKPALSGVAPIPRIPPWNIRISRFNPLLDFHPRTHDYTISPREGESLLDLLLRIKHTQDGSLTFRGSCGYGGCGTCGIKVHGKPLLACVTQVTDVVDARGGLDIQPLHDTIIKDLVVDEQEFFQKLLTVKPWIVPRKNDERRMHRMGINDVQKMGKTPQCILCGICDASAENQKKGDIGPSAFVKAYRYIHDIRDGNRGRLASLRGAFPISYSLSAANECPREIGPGDRIRELEGEMKKGMEKRTAPMESDKNNQTKRIR